MPTVELGHLQVLLEAQTAKFEQQMEKANGKIGRTEAAITKMSRGFRTATAAITAIAGTAGLGLLVKNTINAADEIGKLSTRLGISTEALSQYQHVADLSGVSFNTLTMGLQRMTRRVAEAAQGTGEARGALKELGLSAQSLAQQKPDQQFEILADAIGKVGNSSDRVRLAMKLFDSEGVSLLQTMENGADGIRAWRDQADQLGLTISQKTAKSAAELNDQLTVLGGRVQGLVREGLPGLISVFSGLVSILEQALQGVSNFGDALGELRSGPTDAVKLIRQEIELAEEELAELQRIVAASSQAGRGFALPERRLQEHNQRIKDLQQIIKNLKASAESIPRRNFLKALDESAISLIDNVQGPGGAIEAVQELKAEVEDETDTLSRAMDLIDRQFEELEQQEAKVFAGLQEITKETKKTETATKQLKVQVSETAQIYKDTATSIRQAFSDAFFRIFDEGMDGFSDFADRIKDAFKRMLADLVTLAIAQPIIVPVFSALGGLIGAPTGAAGGQLGGGGLPGLPGGISPGSIGSFFGGNSIGAGFESFGFNFSPFSSISAESPAGIFSGAGAYPNWAYGLAGVGGGLVGQQLFGGYGGLGGGAGAALGLALGGPLGAVAGGLAGGALGGLFGGGRGTPERGSYTSVQFNTGEAILHQQRQETSAELQQLTSGVQAFHEALERAGGTGTGEGLLRLQFGAQSGFNVQARGFGQNIDAALVHAVQAMVDNFEGLDDELVNLIETFKGGAAELAKAIDDMVRAGNVADQFITGSGFNVGGSAEQLTQAFIQNLPIEERLQRLSVEVGDSLDALGSDLGSFDDDLRAFMSGNVIDLEEATDWLRAAEQIRIMREIETGLLEDQRRAEEELINAREESLRQAAAAREAVIAETISALTGLVSPVSGFAGQQQGRIAGLTDAGSALRDAFRGLNVGELSTLLPLDQIGAAESEFQRAVSAARGGDVTAAGQLPVLAEELLGLSRDYFASNAEYSRIFDEVQTSLEDVADSMELRADLQQAALERQLDTLINVVEQSSLEGSENIVAELDELLGAVREGSTQDQRSSDGLSNLLNDIKVELGRLRRQQEEAFSQERRAA